MHSMNSTTLSFDDEVVFTTEVLSVVKKVLDHLIIMFLMVCMGSTMDFKELRQTLCRPTSFIIGLTCQFCLMPLLAFSLAIAFQLDTAGALSLVILACCPEGALSNLFTYWTNGEVCHCVCMTGISTFLSIGMMPLNLFIYSRRWTNDAIVVPYVDIVAVFVSVIVPVAFGVTIRWWKKERMKILTRIGITVLLGCLLTSLAINIFLNRRLFRAEWRLWVCTSVLPLFGLSVGYTLAYIFHRNHRKCRTIAFEMGSQNAALATTLTALTFADSPLYPDMLIVPFLYKLFIYLESLVVVIIYNVFMVLLKENRSLEIANKNFRGGGEENGHANEGMADDIEDEESAMKHDCNHNHENGDVEINQQ